MARQIGYGALTITDVTDGINNATVYLYQRFASVTGHTPPANNRLTYNFTTGKLTGATADFNGWSQTIPNGNDPLYVVTAVATSVENTYIIPAWSDETRLVVNGEDGTDGIDGTSITAVKEVYYFTTGAAPAQSTLHNGTAITSTSTGSNVWTTVVPAYSAGGHYYTSLQTSLSKGTSPVFSAISLNQALTDANNNAAIAKSIAQANEENAQGALAISQGLESRLRYIWVNLNDPSSLPTDDTKIDDTYYLGGTYAASGIDGVTFNTSKASTYGWNSLLRHTKLMFRYNGIALTTLGIDGLKLFSPIVSNSKVTDHRLGIELTATKLNIYNPASQKVSMMLDSGGLTLYKYNSATVAATLNSTGLNIAAGSIKLGDNFEATSEGVITAKSGTVGNLHITNSSLYTGTHSAYNSAVAGIFINDNYISFGSGAVTYFKNDGSAKIGNWHFNTAGTQYADSAAISSSVTKQGRIYLAPGNVNTTSVAIGIGTRTDSSADYSWPCYMRGDGYFYASNGKIGPWTLSTTYIRNGAITGATNTSVAGVYLGTDGLNISNGTAATTAYITKTAVNIGNKLTWNGTTLSVNGAITATSLTVGTDATITDSSGKITNSTIYGNLDNFTILWNYENFSTANNGEGYICKYDPATGTKSDANGTVLWNGVKRTITKQMINPNTILPYNIPIYVVCRLSSATATTGTNYMVWYNSGWKYAAMPTPSAVGGTWTWTENRDIILGKFVEPSSEAALIECEVYNPPWGSKQVTSVTTTAASAQALANTANNNASDAATKATNYLYYDSTNGLRIAQSSPSSATTNMVQIKANDIRIYGNNVNGYTKVTSTGMEVFSNISSKATSVASFGSTARIGINGKQRVEVGSSNISIYDSNNKERTQINTSGLLIKNANGNTKATIYDTITLYGGAGTYPLTEISGTASNGIKVAADANNYSRINSSGMQVYQGGVEVATFGSTARIGIADKQRIYIAPGGVDIYGYSSSTSTAYQLCHIGCASGTASSGTAVAPYYTFGGRSGTIGNNSCVIGSGEASGFYSFVFGVSSKATGAQSLAFGFGSTASGEQSIAFGEGTEATKKYSISGGLFSKATADYSCAIGASCEARNPYSLAFGQGCVAAASSQTAIGVYNVIDNGSLFIVGNGTAITRQNAFSISRDGITKITANGNTISIGSQNAGWCHIYNSANVPFIFNKTVTTTSGNLGTTDYPWGNLYMSGHVGKTTAPTAYSQTCNAVWHKASDSTLHTLCQPTSSSMRYKEDIMAIEESSLDSSQSIRRPSRTVQVQRGVFGGRRPIQ